ncbi:MAG: metalloregulator ArsR/SmtB family transcription factor [Planctomycetota bacterium]|nr:metalloregulator ArsR/SmtB family transcription factor [Planctomycetota bacterium]
MFKMLSDPTRLKIVMMLLQEEDELHVTGLCERLGQSQPAVSHHLALMKASDLIDVRRKGKHNFYFVNRSHFHEMMGNLFRFIGEDFGGFESDLSLVGLN